MDISVKQELDTVVRHLIAGYKPEKIILFGSAASGQMRRNSDLDLFIIKKSDKKRAFRVKEVFESLRGLKRAYALDTIVYTPEELQKRIIIGDPFVKNVIQTGKILYE